MNLDETPEELEARARMATALQRLGHSLVGHRVDADLAGRIADLAAAATEEVSARPARDRTAEIATRTLTANRRVVLLGCMIIPPQGP